jgi:hypothetical protein
MLLALDLLSSQGMALAALFLLGLALVPLSILVQVLDPLSSRGLFESRMSSYQQVILMHLD